MGIFEIIGELINPGAIGTIDVENKPDNSKQKFIIARFVVSLILIGLVEYWLFTKTVYGISLGYMMKANGALAIYLLIGYFIQVKPNYDNLGWIPFIINNPFRFSDNINRLLVLLMVLFIPGKYVANSIVEFYRQI